jgi:signal transduction histidine kinase
MPVTAFWNEHGRRTLYEPGEYIFRLGDPADTVFWISAGRVALLKESRTEEPKLLGYRSTGEILGEASLTGEEMHTEWALTVEPVETLAIGCDAFWKLLDDDPVFRREMFSELVHRLMATDESHLRAVAHETDLFDRVSSLSDENVRMAELMQLRNDTTHFIIHDLRNPLNMINSAVGMLDSYSTGAADEETRTLILVARRGVQRMLSLVDTLLDVDRLEGGAALDLEPLSIGRVVDEVYQRIQPLAAVSDIAMTLELPKKPLPDVMADRQSLDRVITNLVDNALKFTLPESQVALSAWHDDSQVYVAVDDQGTGIAPEQRIRIFERFAQLEAGPEGRRGFGLGLAYCRSAIAAHDGKIWVEDAPGGVGMRFMFSLPIIPAN